MRFLLVIAICFLSNILQSNATGSTCKPTNNWCRSCNDPHMTTIDGTNFEFQYSGNFYVMYTNYKDTQVTASFQRCNANYATPTCNCGVHIKFRQALFFLNTCGTIPTGPLQFYSGQAPTVAPTVADCSKNFVPAGKDTDDTWWNAPGNAAKIQNKFLCAKHQAQPNTYIIRTNDISNNGNNIYVKLILHDRGISCIYIRPASCDFGKTGGLCGNYSTTTGDDLIVYNCTGVPDGTTNGGYSKFPANALQMSKFWKLDRCAPEELHYKQFDIDTCLCDKSTPDNNNDCAVPLSICGPSATGRPWKPSPCGCVHNVNAFPSDRGVAIAIIDAFFQVYKLFEAVLALLLEQAACDLLREWGTSDYMSTSDNYWTLNTCQIGRNWALDTCGESNKHPLCTEFKIPTKCLCAAYRELLSDDGGVERCPPKNNCPPPNCPILTSP